MVISHQYFLTYVTEAVFCGFKNFKSENLTHLLVPFVKLFNVHVLTFIVNGYMSSVLIIKVNQS